MSSHGFGSKFLANAREKTLTILEVGASFGLSHNRLIPNRAKVYAKTIYTSMAGLGQGKKRSWDYQTFGYFWDGQFQQAADSLLAKLAQPSALTLEHLDFCVRLMWHGAVNQKLEVTDALQTAFEAQIALLSPVQIQSRWATAGQWLAARQLTGGAAITWQPSEQVLALAALAHRKDLKISDNFVESVGAIRFGLPETWIIGHEDQARSELQVELRDWLRWVAVSNDSETLRHARRLMLRQKLGSSEIVIEQGTPNASNLALLREGLTLPSLKRDVNYSPTPNTGLYFLHNSLPWDSQGYATRSHSIIKSLNSRGWKISGITRLGYPFDRHTNTPASQIPDISEIDGVTYYRMGRKIGRISNTASFLIAYANKAADFVSQLKPSVIHSASNSWNGLVANHLAREFGLPSVYEVRGLWEVTARSRNAGYEFTARHRLQVRLETQAALEADQVFALTNALKQELIRRGVDGEKITLLPNCVDADRFEPRIRDTELEEQLGFGGKTVIGYVGSLLDYEGLDLLIQATDVLKSKRDDFRVLIVGSGAAHERLVALTDELNLNSLIKFTGRVPHAEVEKYYSLIDVAPFPRLALPVCEMVSPLKPFEAMAMEKACVVSSVDALTEIVQEGVTGRVFEKDSAADLARVLAELLDDPAQIKNYGVTSRQWVLGNRTWDHDAKIVHEAYERLLSRPVN
jgi:glycosyltransferase involved in cell wall biosynthesis